MSVLCSIKTSLTLNNLHSGSRVERLILAYTKGETMCRLAKKGGRERDELYVFVDLSNVSTGLKMEIDLVKILMELIFC